MIIFFSSVISVLYYLGIMPLLIAKIAWLMQITMKTSGVESLTAAGNIFVGQVSNHDDDDGCDDDGDGNFGDDDGGGDDNGNGNGNGNGGDDNVDDGDNDVETVSLTNRGISLTSHSRHI